MAKANTYKVTAYDAQGAQIHGETFTRIAQARKVAREFMPYVNVFTVDITRENATRVSDYVAERYVKLSPNSGIVIIDGESRNIRF